MTTRRSVAIFAAVLVMIGLVVALQLSAAQEPASDGDQGETQVTREEPRVVAAVPAESVTEYEPDPFEPERLRSSTVRVKRVAVVYSDGTIRVEPCP